MVVFETGAPRWGLNQTAKGGRDVHKKIAHQKENGDKGRDAFDFRDQNEN